MTEKPEEPGTDEKHRMSFLGLVLFLRQMAAQLIEQEQMEEARGLIDSVESLQFKTRGNLADEEEKLLESVLFELRMAVVRGPAASEPPAEEPAPDPEAKEGD